MINPSAADPIGGGFLLGIRYRELLQAFRDWTLSGLPATAE